MTDREPARLPRTLVIACGALAREIVALRRLNGWENMAVQCLPADLHNRPDQIPDAVAVKLDAAGAAYDHIFVAYADCGTGGRLDRVLERFSSGRAGVNRLPGAHCYELFAGARTFSDLCEAEPGTFYVTDFLVRHFDRLVVTGLGLDRHPELESMYFGNYRKLVYLAQADEPSLEALAEAAARRLGLTYELHRTGYDGLETGLRTVIGGAIPSMTRVRAGKAAARAAH